MYNIGCLKWVIMTIKRKKEIYKSIASLLMGGVIIGTPITYAGCSNLDGNSRQDGHVGNVETNIVSINNQSHNKYSLDKNYALISFGNTVQVIEYSNYVINEGLTEIIFDTGDTIYIANSNVLLFDIDSKKQVDLVNNILNENEKETVPYTYVRK